MMASKYAISSAYFGSTSANLSNNVERSFAVVFFQDLKASLADSTARSTSLSSPLETCVTVSSVVGLNKANDLPEIEGTHYRSDCVFGTLIPHC